MQEDTFNFICETPNTGLHLELVQFISIDVLVNNHFYKEDVSDVMLLSIC